MYNIDLFVETNKCMYAVCCDADYPWPWQGLTQQGNPEFPSGFWELISEFFFVLIIFFLICGNCGNYVWD